MSPVIYIDADACPVKDETYKVAHRYALKVFVVSNAFITLPKSPLIERRIVESGADQADDWIVAALKPGDIVITNDMPLAGRALMLGAFAVSATGKPFTHDSIGMALAHRSIMEHIRSTGEITGGPPPFSAKDRSKFLQALDQIVTKALKTLS